MILDRLADLIRLRTRVELAPVQPVQGTPAIGGRDFELGAIVRALVVSVLPRGVVEARIADRAVTLQLPYQAQRGDQLQLVVTSREPQLQFALAPRADGTSSNTNAAPRPDTISSNTNAAPRFEVGSFVRGQVMALLPRDLAEVLVGDRSVVVHLPYKAEPGDQLQLVVTSPEPQLKFALSQRADGIASTTRLSETAHFVTALLREQEKLPLAESARVRQPLITGPEVNSVNIAASLKQALAHSGIFYEAHQAEWVSGHRLFADLMHEPQARLPPLQEQVPDTQEQRSFDPLPTRSESPVHREALAIVKQQLETLDTRHLAWGGVVWPGQTMDWEVSEAPQHGKSTPEEPQWRTTLHLDLPRLGRLNASLGITPGGVTIMLRVQSAESATTMVEHHVTLKRALLAAGVTPLDIVVRKDEHA